MPQTDPFPEAGRLTHPAGTTSGRSDVDGRRPQFVDLLVLQVAWEDLSVRQGAVVGPADVAARECGFAQDPAMMAAPDVRRQGPRWGRRAVAAGGLVRTDVTLVGVVQIIGIGVQLVHDTRFGGVSAGH